MSRSISRIACFVLSLVMAMQAHAGVITTYDATNVRLPGFGGWSHSYFGSITPTGNPFLYNYSGGSGTINDGSFGTNVSDTHLFQVPDSSTLTFHLDQIYSHFSEIRLYGFAAGNLIPGSITAVDVTIGGITETISTVGFGPPTFYGNAHELLNVAGTSLEFASGNTIRLSNFQSADNYFAISEATYVASSVAAVPEPASFTVFGLGAIGLLRRRIKRS